MAQGLDLKQWNSDKSPSMDSKAGETVKKARGVGSRRIFPPQFKLQVLDSYRNDVDCRGNQRATARKYNIHRRQIQKWLQCEQNLRITVEDNAKNELETKNKKKSDSEEDKTDLTLNQSATAFARLGDAGKPKENRPESAEDSKLEAQNLKRVAQKLYPSLQHGEGGKLVHPSDVAYAFRVPPTGPEGDTRDDNFNKVPRTDDGDDGGGGGGGGDDDDDDDEDEDGPLDLKSKVRSEVLPEEFLAGGPSPDGHPDKLNMGRDRVQCSGLGSSSENVGGQKLSVSNAVLKCLVQKYTGDTDGREFYTRDAEERELLCSPGVNRAESSSLSDAQVPKKSNSVPHSQKRGPNEGGERTVDDCSPKKPKTEAAQRRVAGSKSFNPKRRWIEESMQEMDAEHLDTSSLPIKQRVKLNLRSLPEATYTSEASNRCSGISSNFTIERLCSNDSPLDWRTTPRTPTFHVYPPGLPLKEEKVSDSEDADVDILSTTPVEKKSFDFSTYNFGKRRSFSVQFKLTVLDAFYHDKDCNKNQRATARKFNINRRQVQKWLSQESDLRSEGSVKNGKYLQRQRLGAEPREPEGCTRCPQHCLRKMEDAFDKTIEVNVKHCSDNECLTRRDKFVAENAKTRLMDDFYSKNLFQSDLKTANFYHNYLFPENNNMIYHDSILGWPNLSTSALAVPNFQYLSTWHHNFDFCPENQKIY